MRVVTVLSLALSGCPDRDPPPADPPAAPAGAPEGAPAEDPLQGRKIWMVNAPEDACRAAEARGLTVTCEPSRPGAPSGEIVAWCPEIRRADLVALLAALGRPGFAVRSWEDQPAEEDPDECGQFFEITLRY